MWQRTSMDGVARHQGVVALPYRGGGFFHDALLYRGADEYADGTVRFIDDGLDAGEPVLVAVPPRHLETIRAALNGQSSQVQFLDMTELGRNPSRIIPTVRAWVDQQRAERCRFIGEPIWAGRSDTEVIEATR
jgi:hypothetical protein